MFAGGGDDTYMFSSVVFHDDSQVVEVVAQKRYTALTDPPHVTITVAPTVGAVTLQVTNAPLFEVITQEETHAPIR